MAFSGGSITVNAGATGTTTLALTSAASTSTIGTITLNGGADAAHSATLVLGSGTYNITSLVVTGLFHHRFRQWRRRHALGRHFNIPSGTLSIANWVNCYRLLLSRKIGRAPRWAPAIRGLNPQ
jgi:hypothetical protein